MSPTLTPHLAAVLHGPADIRLEHRTLFRPARGAARIRILATGLCGSDLHYFADARNGDFAVRAPLVLGHEAVGEVEAAGAGAVDAYGRQLQVGTRVAIEPGVPCCIDTAGNSSGAGAASSASAKSCTHCASGRYNLCKDLRFASSAKTFPHLDGTLQEKMLHPAALLWPLPDSVSPALGALAEPLSVVLHASRRAQLFLHPRSLAALPSPSTSNSPSSTPSTTPSPSVLSSSPSSTSPTPSPLHSTNPNPPNPITGIGAHVRQQDILILGAGTIGLAAAALAQCYGARKVVCVDINRRRLEFAKAEGFVDDYYVLARDVPASASASANGASNSNTATSSNSSNSSNSSTSPVSASTLALERGRERAAAALKHFEQPDGFDIVYECTGAEACIQMAVYAATTGGKILLVGMGTRNITLPLSAAALREVDILGSFRYAHTYAEVLRLLGVFAAHPRRGKTSSTTTLSESVTSDCAASPEGSTTTTASIATSKSSGVEGQAQAQAQGERVGEAELVGEAEGAARWPAAPRRTLPDLTRLITHTFPLADTQKAFEMMRAGVDAAGGMVMKVVIQ
ncbi:hypothetical protein PC9H_008627 [Pleurotus ostreatus]|uniref:Uncharacterized protein n=1 Tax=Pleurotus ostreatus TaxID=5322 RepID=A0A8H6ZRN4_PLEOS|nr:uncharacterized protein PC9H_008627 [Pleurotus ostreatus]KAF7426259.1 hypothetical protein PC9H_008627 [Pleurotus ostreatus]